MHSRQQHIVPSQRMDQSDVCLVGCGAVGRKVAEYLANMGLSRITLIDFDTVDEINLHTQGWRKSDIGQLKADALADHFLAMSTASSPEVDVVSGPFRAQYLKMSNVVFTCVDKMDVRHEIADAFMASEHTRLLVDGRMLGLSTRVLTSTKDTMDAYRSHLNYSDDQAVQGRCTSEGTVFSASFNAAMLVNEFTKWLRGEPTVQDWSIQLQFGLSNITDHATQEAAASAAE